MDAPARSISRSGRPLAAHGTVRTHSHGHTWRRHRMIPATMPQVVETMPTPRAQRMLGAYLFGLCLYQIGIYCWPSGPPFVLDPRAGIPVLLINHFNFDNKVIYPVEWITAAWLVIAAAIIFFRGRLVRTYALVEIVLAAPTAYYIYVLATQGG